VITHYNDVEGDILQYSKNLVESFLSSV